MRTSRYPLALCCALTMACNGSGAAGNTDGATDSQTDSATTGSTGSTTGTSTTATGSTGSTGGPKRDVPDCVDGCAPNDFNVEHVSGINYAGQIVHALSPPCQGSICPTPLAQGTYGAEVIVPCEQTQEAIDSPRGPEAYCKLAPVSITFGLDVGFTLPPARDSLTLERTRLDDGAMVEDYVWWSEVVEFRGPGTNYNGDFERGSAGGPDLVTNARNLACIENLDELGIAYDPNDLATACAATFDSDGQITPLRTRVQDILGSYPGRRDTRALSCSTPNGVDDCCTACDHELSVSVAKYGVDGGARRSPNAGTAIMCDPLGDRLASCRDFVPDVDRARETSAHSYAWDAGLQDWPLPRYDKVRETHPGDRPAGAEPQGSTCASDGDCASGQECIGSDGGGDACKTGAGCSAMRCIAEWFVDCRAEPDTTGAQGYCVDKRFRNRAAAACLATTAPFDGVGGSLPAGSRLAHCDTTTDANYTAAECCQASLGAGATCDPFFQPEVTPLPRHDRDPAVTEEALCTCTDATGQPAGCGAVLDQSCVPPVGLGTDPGGASPPDDYALRAVTARGGVRFDPGLDGFDLRIANQGDANRSLVERCAEQVNLIGDRNVSDGWLANENTLEHRLEDFDRALCSGSTYTLHFAGPNHPQHVEAEAGFTLEGKRDYTIETVEFLVRPGSGFPTDNLNVSACDDFDLSFSNKYDLSVDNQRKISIWELEDQGGEWVPVQRIAGGRDCDPDATAGDVQMGAVPCLVVDVDGQRLGELSVRIDFDVYGQLLESGKRYRIDAPGLASPAEIADQAKYVEAFHDACGMPLITDDLPDPEYVYEVGIDSDCP